jgi:hypothetical protein
VPCGVLDAAARQHQGGRDQPHPGARQPGGEARNHVVALEDDVRVEYREGGAGCLAGALVHAWAVAAALVAWDHHRAGAGRQLGRAVGRRVVDDDEAIERRDERPAGQQALQVLRVVRGDGDGVQLGSNILAA